jgi:DNA-directed RNA polymerase sigma subunit (sigma70/sigma32)
LEHAMATELDPLERDVLRLRLGLDDGVLRSCQEVSQVCGGRMSSREIRTAEQHALRKLRSPVALATYKLLTFLDFADVDRETVKIR